MKRLAILGLLLFAPAAQAAYEPTWSFRLSDSRPAAAPAIVSTLTQAQGESATRRVAVHYPAQFGFNPGFSVSGCAPAQEQGDACPESSRIGTTRAVTLLGSFSGPVYLTEDFRLLAHLRGLGGAVGQTFEGKLYLEPDGSVETVFDDLPNFQATLAEIAVEGGRRGIVQTPRRCGRYELEGVFDSHAGDRVSRRAAVQIAGCPVRPEVTRARLRPRRFRRRATLRWRLSRPAVRTSVSVQRLRRGEWREVRILRGAGRAGANSLRISGRRLRPGRYRFVLRARGAGGMLSRSLAVRARRLR